MKHKNEIYYINANPVLEIRDATLSNDIGSVRPLWTDFLNLGNDNMQMLYGAYNIAFFTSCLRNVTRQVAVINDIPFRHSKSILTVIRYPAFDLKVIFIILS